LLFRNELPPNVEPRRLCLRHVASIGDRPSLAKGCSYDAYRHPGRKSRSPEPSKPYDIAPIFPAGSNHCSS
jgi:hypothetical protein